MEVWETKKSLFKGWKPFFYGSGTAATYHAHLQKLRQECPPTSLRELDHIAVQAARSSGSRRRGPKGIKRPGKSLELKDLILQRKETRDRNGRRILSKRIHKQARRELREWKLKWTEHLLEKFENTKYF